MAENIALVWLGNMGPSSLADAVNPGGPPVACSLPSQESRMVAFAGQEVMR